MEGHGKIPAWQKAFGRNISLKYMRLHSTQQLRSGISSHGEHSRLLNSSRAFTGEKFVLCLFLKDFLYCELGSLEQKASALFVTKACFGA